MRHLVRQGEYSLTEHAEEELYADQLSPYDLEEIVAAGFIVDRQRDPLTSEWKYLVEGPTTGGEWAAVVAEISVSARLVFLTVFRL